MQNNIQLQFQLEKLKRTIEGCKEIDLLRELSLEILNLHRSKSAIASWAAKRAADAEKRALIAESKDLEIKLLRNS